MKQPGDAILSLDHRVSSFEELRVVRCLDESGSETKALPQCTSRFDILGPVFCLCGDYYYEWRLAQRW